MERPFDIGTRPQLLLDDSLISRIIGFTHQLHAVDKRPEPVLIAEAHWERPGTGALWGPLHIDRRNNEFRLFYHAYGNYPARGQESEPSYRCVATSKDGVHFKRPKLGLFDYEGSRENNIFGTRSGPGGRGHGLLDGALVDLEEPPEYRYKSVGWLRRNEDGEGGHGVAFSEDGFKWRRRK